MKRVGGSTQNNTHNVSRYLWITFQCQMSILELVFRPMVSDLTPKRYR